MVCLEIWVKQLFGVIEGDATKVGKSLLRAGGHTVSTVVGYTASEEVMEQIDEKLDESEEMDN